MKNCHGKENEPRIENENMIGIEIVRGIGKEIESVIAVIETEIVIGKGIVIEIVTGIGAEIETEVESGRENSGIETEIPIGIGIGMIGLGEMTEIVTGNVTETEIEKEVIAVHVNTRKSLVTENGTEAVVVGEVVQGGVQVAENDLLYLWKEYRGEKEVNIHNQSKDPHCCRYLQNMWVHLLTIMPIIIMKAQVQEICTDSPHTCTLMFLRDHRITTTGHIPEVNANHVMALGNEARFRHLGHRDHCCISLQNNLGKLALVEKYLRNVMMCLKAGKGHGHPPLSLLLRQAYHCGLQRDPILHHHLRYHWN